MGYREAFDVLAGRADLASAAVADAQRTWAYARRQRTWFRAEPDLIWLDPSGDVGGTAYELVVGFLRRSEATATG